MRHVIRGFRDLPGYGDHPGVVPFVFFCFMGFIGAGWLGLLAMIVVFGPILCWGAYSRSKEWERANP